MKKKVINHAGEIAICGLSNGFEEALQYLQKGNIYVTDAYRILQIEDLLPDTRIKVNASSSFRLAQYMEQVNDADLDYTLHKLPSVREIKEGITALCGRKRDPVAWTDGYICCNARYLAKAMEALNASVCYASRSKTRFSPILLVEDDDPQSITKELIMPIMRREGASGFYLLPDK